MKKVVEKVINECYARNKLADYIGKEPANKLLKQDALTTNSGITAQTLEGR
jgi:hypothetical protein